MSALDLTKPVATVAAPARDTAAQYIPAGEDNYREVKEERDALAAENEGLRRRVESMQHVVNCASIFAGLSDMDEIDGEEEHEAMMRLLEAVDGYRAALAKETTTATAANLLCFICGSTEHRELCDSPGAILTFTTGCPVHDAKEPTT